jgi:hypothetical protein
LKQYWKQLSDFGEFHIIEEVQEDNSDMSEYKNSIQSLKKPSKNVDALIKQFTNEKGNLFGPFQGHTTNKKPL